MAVIIREVISRRDLKRFICLPAKIHANHKNWVPPVYQDERVFYNPGKNRSFQHCSTVLYLAYKEGKLSGRIMGIINHTYNSLHDEQNARMFAMDCFYDHEVALALTKAVEDWSRKQGMKKIVGPFGFSDKDPQGFMTEGFDEPMIIATNISLPYMVTLIEQCGYKKEVDLHEYRVDIPEKVPELYVSISSRTLRNNHISLLEFTSRRQLKPFIKPVFELINETFGNIYGFLQLNDGEIKYFVNRYMPICDPEFAKIILDEHRQVVAFVLAIPEISEGIRKARGKLFPFGLFRMVNAAKRTRMLTMLLGAIREDFRNRGLDAILGMKILQSASKREYEAIDSHLVLETNRKMCAEYERFGGQICKRYRIFYKNL